MKQENDSKILKSMMGVLALLLSFSVLLAGCTQTTTVEVDSEDEEDHEEEEAEDNEGAPQGEVVETEVEIEREDTKTEEDKVEEQVEQLLDDGVHTAQVTYNTPGGPELIDISITTEADVVQAVEVTPAGSPHAISLKMITGVNDNIADLVIGKNINEVELPKNIAGSSLTTAAVQKHFDSF